MIWLGFFDNVPGTKTGKKDQILILASGGEQWAKRSGQKAALSERVPLSKNLGLNLSIIFSTSLVYRLQNLACWDLILTEVNNRIQVSKGIVIFTQIKTIFINM